MLSLMYRNNVIYSVRRSFLTQFGRVSTYWLAALCAFVSAIVFDLAIITLRVTFFPKDSDVFAELEKDPLIKARFEQEAALELQQGWNRSKGIRDDEIHALLDQPRYVEEGNGSHKPWVLSTKVHASDTGDETLGSECSGDISGFHVHEPRESSTQARFEDEFAERYGAVVRKPSKRFSTSESD